MKLDSDNGWRFYTNGNLYAAVRVVEKDGKEYLETHKYKPKTKESEASHFHVFVLLEFSEIMELVRQGTMYVIGRTFIPAEFDNILTEADK